MSLIYNERAKLVAAALNNTAVATVITAAFAPVVGYLYGSLGASVTPWWPLIGFAWLSFGAGIHVAALVVLGRLKE